VFDSVGFALEDYSALRFVRDAAQELGLGQLLSLIPALPNPKDLFSLVRPSAVSATPAAPTRQASADAVLIQQLVHAA
jgi:ornithine cyclodeaminase